MFYNWLSFVNEDEDNAEGTPLSNILTGVVLPNEIADRLVNASQIGTTSMHEFINTKLDTNKVCFWNSLKKLKIDTFKVTTRKISLKGTRGKVVTLNADRELFGRLLVVWRKQEVSTSKRSSATNYLAFQFLLYIQMGRCERQSRAH